MTERLSWAEIEKKYPNEWVLIEDIEEAENGVIAAATVAFHSTSKDAVYDHPTNSKHFGIMFTGEGNYRNWRDYEDLDTILHR